ncbi:S41 family peptidase [Flavonifractor sp. An10]|uniref:S41 family peptidase n=1 Tax=Flavonifractor sp. An10 TaxID=1965537 RepID=UPI000B373843|nr:S41 family peptidase [Flavonifractor sp. An10]OUQ79588.1 hypothetical protein B5E42_16355 [Flavonifractor sp. An10]
MKRKLLPWPCPGPAGRLYPAPAPSPRRRRPFAHPNPAAAVDFHAFLDEVNETRRAVIEDGEPLDISAWTPDFTDQNHTFTDEEMEVLLTPHDPAENLTLEQAREDVETAFTLLRTTYGAYEYFGGDEVFDGLREDALARLEEADPALPLADAVADALYAVLSPVVRDGHFVVDNRRLIEAYELSPYYVPGVYIDDPTGLDEDYIKPTIGPDGAITYGFYALSHDGSDLPDSLGGYELDWTLCEPVGRGNFVFAESEYRGIPTLQSRRMSSRTPEEEAQLERFASCGGEYADAPLLIFDVRGNPGGSDRWLMSWFEGWTGQPAQPHRVDGHRYSQLGCEVHGSYYPPDWMGTWGIGTEEGNWVEREGYTFLLTDGGTASSGETAVEFLRTVENTLAVGLPTGGCALVSNNMDIYLPRTGVWLFFGTGLSFHETMENRDGVGYLPDLWVNPAEAPVAVARMCEYYGLRG